jgi:hypothetical protein
MTPDEQRFMAFEGLLGWTAAVVTQAKRVSAARDRLFAELRQRSELRFILVVRHLPNLPSKFLGLAQGRMCYVERND